jgi:hypothetical protein
MGIYDCDQCGKPRINTPSGSVCSSGCGKLWPKIPSGPHKVNEAKLAGLPYATKVNGRWALNGYEGEFEPGRLYSGIVSNAPNSSSDVVAIDDGRLRHFALKEPAEVAAS